MLPIVNPSDLSCSTSETQELRDDEKDSSQLASREEDPRAIGFDDSQTCNFSIRDYVFASRRKNILASWPFPCQILQFCVKHGVRELLPPFEPPSSVRAHCRRKTAAATQKISFDAVQPGDSVLLNGGNKIAQTDSWLPSNDESVKSLDDAVETPISKSAKPVKSAGDECEISSIITATPDIGKILAQDSETVVRSSSSILDLVDVSDQSRAEEIASTTSTVSDPMASKVCPVCKTFSSTSNTTLNAHMDQCLFVESDTNRVNEIVPKVKFKTKRKRLMDDIYSTAPLCTLEDLDRRNGTCWASGLACIAPVIDSNPVTEEPNLLQEQTRNDEQEGAVYVDSNGIKLRILSKFNDSPQVISKEELLSSRNMESLRDGKLLSMEKKSLPADKHPKKMKMKLKKRKLSSLKLLKDKTLLTTPEVAHEETRVDEQRPHMQLPSKQDYVSICESTSLRRWPCSKRSHLSKKFVNKNFQKSLDSIKPLSGIPSHETKTTLSTFAANSHIAKSYRPPDSAAVDFTAKAVENMVSPKDGNLIRPLQGTSTNVVRLKLPRLSEAFVSSPRSTSEDLSSASKKYERPTESSLHSLKSRRFLNLSETNSVRKNLCKYSFLKSGKRKRVISDEYSGLQKLTHTVTEFPADVLPETSLNTRNNQRQYSEPRDSEVLTEAIASPSERRAALGKAASGCIILQTSTENQSLPSNVAIKTSSVQPAEEEQVLHFKQDKQAANELSRTMSAQESSACLTSHGDLRRHDYLEDPIVQKEDNNLAIEKELSGSPASSASTISPPYPDYSYLKSSCTETITRPSVSQNMTSLHSVVASEGTQGTNVLGNRQIRMDFTARPHEQQSDYQQPCCCVRQSILTTNPLTPKGFPDFFARSSISYLSDSYSESRADTVSTPMLESPTESVMSKAYVDSASPNPSCGTPAQPSTGSVFRLMGKNLMVMNTEESNQLPKLHPPNTVDSSNGQAFLPSSSAFATFPVLPTHHGFSNTIRSSPPCEGLFYAQQAKMNQEARTGKEQVVLNDRQDEDPAYRSGLPRVSVVRPMLQRSFPWFSSHGQLLSLDSSVRPAFFVNRGSSWKCPAPPLQSPVVFQPPASQLNASLHHLQPSR